MKLNTILTTFLISLFLISCQTQQNSDSVVDSKINTAMTNDEKISAKNSEFLIQMADSRLMNIAAGELAEKKAFRKSLKEYGRKMVMDQDLMLEELRSLAQMNGITLPKEMSDDKKATIKNLQKLLGRNFDRIYFSITLSSNESDILKFNNVKISETHVNDPAIAAYAKNRLPMIQGHLDQLRAIKK